jgi:hypothetical protein
MRSERKADWRARRALPLMVAVFSLVPNEPHRLWYAGREVGCGLVTPREDEWRCDEPPVDGGLVGLPIRRR